MSADIHEECKTCPHKSLCYQWLEFAGEITYPGKKVRAHLCDDIKDNPEKWQNILDENIQKWKAQIDEYNKSGD